MIRSVTVTNHIGERLVMELSNPEPSGLIVRSITGLGPSTATINTVELATADGALFSSARVSPRNIVLTLAPTTEPSIEINRQKTYRYFPVKKPITLMFETDRRRVEATGYVESNEPDIFSNDETIQVSVVCPDPYLYAVGNSATSFYGVYPNFQFPFPYEEGEDDFSFGELRLDTRTVLNYIGDVDTGLLISIHAVVDVNASAIQVVNHNTNEQMVISLSKIQQITGIKFGAGDTIEISTYQGSKFIRLLHNGTYRNVIAAMNLNSDWFRLEIGDNVFSFTTGDEAEDSGILVTFTYRNAYGGI